MRPDAHSSHFSRKFDTANKVDLRAGRPGLYYTLGVPGHFRGDHSRTVHDVDILPAHEALASEVADTPDMARRLELALHRELLPLCYYSHPVVVEAPMEVPVYPIAFYVDGMQYTRVDSVIGFAVYNLLTGKRHASVVFREADLCTCGCKGWCSMYPILLQVHWSLLSLARGRKPLARHDHTQFTSDEDAVRLAEVGQVVEFRMACLL